MRRWRARWPQWHWRAVLLGWGLALSSMSAASPWSSRAWQVEEGLPDNNVTGVAQTPEGYLWLATHAGLARFDGVRFQLTALPGSSIRSNILIRAMLLGREKTIWVALEAERGLVLGISERSNHIYTAADGLPGFKPLVITQTGDGAIWVGYVDGSACRLQDGKVTRYGPADGLSGSSGCWLATDREGQLWFAKAGRVGCFRNGRFEQRLDFSDRIIRIAAARAGGMWICSGKLLMKLTGTQPPISIGMLPAERAGVEPAVLFEDRTGGVWIGTTAGGLFHWDGKTIVAADTSHSDITSITEDREGNIWVGTEGGGLDRLRNRVLEFYGSASGLPFETARSICEDTAGRIWATGANGALARREGERWEVVSEQAGWAGARPTCVTSDRAGGVWIGTYRGGLVHWRDGKFSTLTRADGLAGENIRALLVDQRTNLWIGLEATNCLQRLDARGFTTFSQPAGSRTIRAVVEDAAGKIWLGTSDGFLLRVEGELLVDESRRALQPSKPIRGLHADGAGGLWIGYAGAGLGWLHEGKFKCFTPEQGLLDSFISGIESDGGNMLWLASGHGIFSVSQRELEAALMPGADRALAVDFGRNESLPNLQGSYGHAPATWRARDGRLWFATRSGLVVANPTRMQPNRIPPQLVIEHIILDGRELSMGTGPRLLVPPGHRRLGFEFTAFSFADPDGVAFKYKLEGWDDDWRAPTGKRTVDFQSLAAGDYTLRVVARNGAGVWNREGVAVAFTVIPFFYQRWWFRIAVGMGGLALLVVVIRGQERRKLRRALAELERHQAVEKERARIARDIHDELGTGLTQISLLADVGCVKPGDAQEAEANFTKIAERSRAAVRSLDGIVWAANPRNDFLPRLADYLCHLMEDGFEGSAVRCRKEVPTGLPPIPVGAELRHNLALAVKEALANALRHSQARTVKLKLEWNAPELVVTVEDDGVGFSRATARSLGNGLSNQAARMQGIGGTAEIHSAPGQGTRCVFRVRIPDAPA